MRSKLLPQSLSCCSNTPPLGGLLPQPQCWLSSPRTGGEFLGPRSEAVGAALPYGHLPHNKTQLDMCPTGLAMPLLANVQDFGFPPSLLAAAMPMDLPTLKANKTHTLAKWMLAASPCLPSTTSTPESDARACQGLPA